MIIMNSSSLCEPNRVRQLSGKSIIIYPSVEFALYNQKNSGNTPKAASHETSV